MSDAGDGCGADVTVGGTAIADLPHEQLRRHVVLVTQAHYVFADWLRDNLTIAAPRATDDASSPALGFVGASWYDELPDGLTDLGTHRIGGAQAQHATFARVAIANPLTLVLTLVLVLVLVLVLDEATALLDLIAAPGHTAPKYEADCRRVASVLLFRGSF